MAARFGPAKYLQFGTSHPARKADRGFTGRLIEIAADAHYPLKPPKDLGVSGFQCDWASFRLALSVSESWSCIKPFFFKGIDASRPFPLLSLLVSLVSRNPDQKCVSLCPAMPSEWLPCQAGQNCAPPSFLNSDAVIVHLATKQEANRFSTVANPIGHLIHANQVKPLRLFSYFIFPNPFPQTKTQETRHQHSPTSSTTENRITRQATTPNKKKSHLASFLVESTRSMCRGSMVAGDPTNRRPERAGLSLLYCVFGVLCLWVFDMLRASLLFPAVCLSIRPAGLRLRPVVVFVMSLIGILGYTMLN